MCFKIQNDIRDFLEESLDSEAIKSNLNDVRAVSFKVEEEFTAAEYQGFALRMITRLFPSLEFCSFECEKCCLGEDLDQNAFEGFIHEATFLSNGKEGDTLFFILSVNAVLGDVDGGVNWAELLVDIEETGLYQTAERTSFMEEKENLKHLDLQGLEGMPLLKFQRKEQEKLFYFSCVSAGLEGGSGDLYGVSLSDDDGGNDWISSDSEDDISDASEDYTDEDWTSESETDWSSESESD